MRRILVALILFAGCSSSRTVSFEGQDDGCEADGCETGTTAIPTTGSSTAAQTSGTEDDGELGEEDTTTHFVPNTDMGDVQACDIWDHEACPADQKCTAYATQGSSWDAHKCVPVMGNDQWRDPCLALGEKPGKDGLDSCAHGLMCWDVDDDGNGFCYEVCKGSPNNPQCPDDGICALYGNGIVNLCLPKCDPLAPQSECLNPDNLCVSSPSGEGFVCTLNASQGMGSYGTECQFANSCSHRLFCAAADTVPDCKGSQGCCSEFCDVGKENNCAGKDGGQECVPWYEENLAPDGYEHVGGCVIPE